MTERNTFGTKDERKIGNILGKAFSITDKKERIAFVEEECGDNRLMFERIMEDLAELEFDEEESPNHRLENGDEIGNYTVIERISQGGFASVYTAEHKILRTLAALKVFDKLEVHEVENDMIWNKDHSSLSKFNHDNIVKLYDVGFYQKSERKIPYIAVELVKGKHLDEHCETKDLSIREVLRLFQDLCDVIKYIHDKEKILHLDLKPSNILVTADRPYRIKLIDFGSSKLFRVESKRFTRSDLLNLLSLKFAPPEQFDNDEELTDQSDVYSLGVVLYLLLTEKVPFGEGEIDKGKIKKDVTNLKLHPVLPSKRVLELNDENKFGVSARALSEILRGDLDHIVMKSTAKRRRNRYASVTELRQDIDNFLRGKPVKARPKTVGYKMVRSISQFFGMRGGLAGWEKWKSPVKRSAGLAVLLVLLGFVSTEIYGHFWATAPPSSKKMGFSRGETVVRTIADGKTQDKKIKEAITVTCGERTCFTFLQIESGRFEMGRLPEDHVDPNPNTNMEVTTHTPASVGRFYLAQFEIINYQWNLVAAMPKVKIDLKPSETPDYLPKTKITYLEIQEFCERLKVAFSAEWGKTIVVRLPTEAEWEYACRTGSRLKYGMTDEFLVEYTNAVYIPRDTDNEKTPGWARILLAKVETRPLSASNFVANGSGLIAMNGNVAEMTSSEWRKNYDEAPADNKRSDNAGDKLYVRRGGAYNSQSPMTQCLSRMPAGVESSNEQSGFRILVEAAGID